MVLLENPRLEISLMNLLQYLNFSHYCSVTSDASLSIHVRAREYLKTVANVSLHGQAMPAQKGTGQGLELVDKG